MPPPFDVELVTPERIVYEGPAQQLSVKGAAGSLGILANHAPLLTELRIGEALLTEPGGHQRHFYIGGGFLEVNKNRVTILADDAIGEDDMDPAEAERLLQAAREAMTQAGDTEEASAAKLQVERATARLAALKHGR